MKILGFTAYYHDSAAALIIDGKIQSAAQEERFTRKKHDASFPINAIKFCLEKSNLTLDELDAIVYYEKPFLKFDRLLETYLAFAPRGFNSFRVALPLWIKEKLFQKKYLIKSLLEFGSTEEHIKAKLLFSEHHLSHAASAFYPSPFENAAVLTLDGVGEWSTTSLAIGSGKDLKIIKEMHFPHSLGLLYSAFTYYTGFKVNAGEYKVMGLAPYGNPIYVQQIYDHLIDVKEDGSFRLNMDYFDFATDLQMTSKKFHKLFGAPPQTKGAEVTQREMDLAASIQVVLEEIVLKLVKFLAQETNEKNLCLAGGVALNCVANGKILTSKYFENIWIQPASGDAGGAIGAALAAHHLHLNQPRKVAKKLDSMSGAYLGPSYLDDEIETALTKAGAKFKKLSDDKEKIKKTALALKDGKAIGWFQGRAEFGPRALGARSILADPRNENMQKNLNLKVKFRESFRPFAPSVLAEDLKQWFELDVESPYMLLVANVANDKCLKMTEKQNAFFGIDKLNVLRSSIPAVTHVDYSARVQTVHKETNELYHGLISEFKRLTGCPVLVNTSFNVRGEPIVGSPEDAFRCFLNTGLDVLVIGNCFLIKEEQDSNLMENYKDQFEFD